MDTTAGGLSRREWGRATALGMAGWFVGDSAPASPQEQAKPQPKPIPIEDADPAEIENRLHEAGIAQVRKLYSTHYTAIGDASEGFFKATLGDCEQLTVDYLRHFETRGFEVHAPDRKLVVIAFRDERSFGKFLRFQLGLQGNGNGVGPAVGSYNRSSNLLNVFDWRNVPMATRKSHRNVETIAHEATHQLTFNTGLLNRSGDAPIAVIEGFGCYGEPRKVIGPSPLGRTNLRRLEELAKLQRITDWIPLHELLVDDKAFRQGLLTRINLAYAQGWLLVHYSMNEADLVPKFRDYLKAIYTRKTHEHRLEDATKHFGDLDALDRSLKAYSIRLLRSL